MKKSLFVLFLSVISMVAAMAQVTTASLGGKVTDADGAIIGATIQAVHTPSGTRYGTITNPNGTYSIQGMRVGGPYTVTVSYVGYTSQVYDDVYLSLGETYSIIAELKERADVLKEVVVMGSGSKFRDLKTGAGSKISMSDMRAVPTVNRSVTDMVRLSPYSNGMSLAGGDGRSTNFTIDGANFNNNFGLSSDLPGGGTPVSIEALQEMQVVVAPFDVRQTNFVGGGINAVTKSGTNTFQGSAYMYQQNDNMGGSRVNNTSFDIDRNNDKHVFGATLGGPIIKDKLFFFVSFEKTLQPSSQTEWRPSEDGVANTSKNLSRASVADMQTVSDVLKNKYGYDTGGWNNYSHDDENTKILARLDWNITDNHHLAVRYNQTDNTAWEATNGSAGNTGKRASAARISQYGMAFANSLYYQKNNVKSWSVDLNSRFGDNIQNQLIATYSDIDDTRGSDSSEFPFIDILDGTLETTGSAMPYISAGYELFTYNNGVRNRTVTVNDNFTYTLGDHKLLAGLSFEHQYANNAYMRNGTGYYRYKSLDDFLNGAAPETVALTYGYNGETEPKNQVTFNQYGLYLQDEWTILRNLKLTYGSRFDLLVFDESDIMTNNAIKKLDYGGRHIDTGKWPTAHVTPSPRVGFNWDVFSDRSFIVRGGTGLFTGRLPLVFFVNMPANSGMIQNVAAIQTTWRGTTGTPDPLLASFAGDLITDKTELLKKMNQLDPSRFPLTITSESGAVSSDVCGIDEDFKMPLQWKSSIGVDYSIPVDFPFTVTAEYTYTDNVYAVMLDNYNVNNGAIRNAERFAGADNRYIYPSDYKYNPDGKTANAFVLTNTRKGYGYTANLTLKAQPLRNLHLMAAYTHTESKAVSGMPGSNAGSAWSALYTVNGSNLNTVQRTGYVMPDRVIASVDWTVPQRKEGWATHYSIFYEGSTPGGYSYTYNNDMNGDGSSYDLIYIPKSKDEIHFVDQTLSDGTVKTADQQAEDFWAFVNHDKYLKRHKGEYAESYAARAPWMNTFDLRIAQDFGIRTARGNRHTLTVSLDFSNIGNMLNSNWGSPKTTLLNSGKFLSYKGKTSDNVPQYTLCYDSEGKAPYDVWSYTSSVNSTWKLQLGVRYTFN